MSTQEFKNSILKTLSSSTINRLHLEPVKFDLLHEIEFPGQPIRNLFFVEEGMASITNTFEDGSQVEVGMFGYESIIGVSALMGTKQSLNRVYTQIPGSGFCCTFEDAKREFDRGEQFQQLALRYVQAQLVQAMQSAGCNGKHEVGPRLARWLLLCADRVHRNQFDMSHEFLSEMLGLTRSSVTRACRVLKNEGLIDYSRGVMHLLDIKALEKKSCECYGIIKNHLDSITEFDTGVPHR